MNGKEENIQNDTTHYQVVVQGELGANWSDWLGDVLFESYSTSSNSDKTTIILVAPDQAALRGLLNKLWDLNLRLISVNLHGSEC